MEQGAGILEENPRGREGRHKSQVNSRTAASFIPETSKAVGESGFASRAICCPSRVGFPSFFFPLLSPPFAIIKF